MNSWQINRAERCRHFRWALLMCCWIAAGFSLIPCADAASPTYATWCMIWNKDSETWWNATNYQGATNFMGLYPSINWSKADYIQSSVDSIRSAGVSAIICDLTNGWNWLDWLVQSIQNLAGSRGMQVCIALNSGGNVSNFEAKCGDVWNRFAGPAAPYPSTYLAKDGKPVIVCYEVRSAFNAYVASTGPNRQKFTLVWASGEDSNVDKWGWQLEPWVGPMASSGTMFVTPSIKWSSSGTSPDLWHKSQAWLDYGFAMARDSQPAFVVVGSFDDIHERNAWIQADTGGCSLSLQMRDLTGALSSTNYYNRVSQWTHGTVSAVDGGAIPDGFYVLTNCASGLRWTMPNSSGTNRGCAGLQLVQSAAGPGLDNYFGFYHLGNNIYRITSLNSGLFLAATNNNEGLGIVQAWNSTDDSQRWQVIPTTGGVFQIQNVASGKVLAVGGSSAGLPVIQATGNSAAAQRWRLGLIRRIRLPDGPPRLSLQMSGPEIQLSWSPDYFYYGLQRSTGASLASVGWEEVTNFLGTAYREPITNNARFFRLIAR